MLIQQGPKIRLSYDTVALRAHFRACRLAVMMALHPRLGSKSPMRIIGKDVARMIARDYLSLPSCISGDLVPTNNRCVNVSLKHPLIFSADRYNQHFKDSVVKCPVTFVDDRMLREQFYMAIKTPVMLMPFGICNFIDHTGKSHYSATFSNFGSDSCPKITMLFKWLKNVDHALQSSLRECGFLPEKTEFQPTLKRPRNDPDGPDSLRVKITTLTLRDCRVFYLDKDSVSLQQALDADIIGKRHTKATAILSLRYVWGTNGRVRFGTMYELEELHIISPDYHDLNFFNYY